MRRIPVGGIAGATVLAACLLASAEAAVADWQGRWIVQQARAAPWTASAQAVDPGMARELRLAPDEAVLPGLPACTRPRYHEFDAPPRGLFEGGLDDGRADGTARSLGFAEGAVRSLRIECPDSAIDLHAADHSTLLFARDNVIYSASRSAGALAPHGTPEAAVQALLEHHFRDGMGFTAARWEARSAMLSAALREALGGYFAADWPKDEVPPIDGDPLTDSQEYPTRFAVGIAAVAAGRARVPVRFADGWVGWDMAVELVDESGWKLDEVVARDGSRLRDVLASRP